MRWSASHIFSDFFSRREKIKVVESSLSRTCAEFFSISYFVYSFWFPSLFIFFFVFKSILLSFIFFTSFLSLFSWSSSQPSHYFLFSSFSSIFSSWSSSQFFSYLLFYSFSSFFFSFWGPSHPLYFFTLLLFFSSLGKASIPKSNISETEWPTHLKWLSNRWILQGLFMSKSFLLGAQEKTKKACPPSLPPLRPQGTSRVCNMQGLIGLKPNQWNYMSPRIS